MYRLIFYCLQVDFSRLQVDFSRLQVDLYLCVQVFFNFCMLTFYCLQADL